MIKLSKKTPLLILIFITINLIGFSLSLQANDLDITDIDINLDIAASCPSQISASDLRDISDRFDTQIISTHPLHVNGILIPPAHTTILSSFQTPSPLNFIDQSRQVNLSKNVHFLATRLGEGAVGNIHYWVFLLFYNTYISIYKFDNSDPHFNFLDVVTSKYNNQNQLTLALEKWSLRHSKPTIFAPRSVLIEYVAQLEASEEYIFRRDELGAFLPEKPDSGPQTFFESNIIFQVLYNKLFLSDYDSITKRIAIIDDPHDLLVHVSSLSDSNYIKLIERFMRATQSIPKELYPPSQEYTEALSWANSDNVSYRMYSKNYLELQEFASHIRALSHEGHSYLVSSPFYSNPLLRIDGNRGFNTFILLKRGRIEDAISILISGSLYEPEKSSLITLEQNIKALKHFNIIYSRHTKLVNSVMEYIQIMGYNIESYKTAYSELDAEISKVTGYNSNIREQSNIYGVSKNKIDGYEPGLFDMRALGKVYSIDRGYSFFNTEIMHAINMGISEVISKNEKLSKMFDRQTQLEFMEMLIEFLEKYVAIVKEENP